MRVRLKVLLTVFRDIVINSFLQQLATKINLLRQNLKSPFSGI